ncbi:MAG: exodeoxyribonuclease V beta subunit [Kangiellaceae bacterium]|jgi:exodeoxyribonuclease V beta subunit
MNAYDILNPLTIGLTGRHMIEASAGTGKTHNITRIYVRLLVEKKLSVQQILVMTFTDAATEEIKARIASFIDTLLNDFETNPCECSQALQAQAGALETQRLLKIAQLEIDLASIYTINGFCQRIIGRFGLSMSLPQNADLVTDFYKIQLAYVSDAIRAMRAAPSQYLLLQNEKLHDPAVFMQNFGKVIGSPEQLVVQTALLLKTNKAEQFNKGWQKHKMVREQLAKDLNTQRSIFYKGTKSSTSKNTDPLIDSAIQWLQKDALIDNTHLPEFINNWLGIEGATKQDIKEADLALMNNGFKNLFSDARIKNYLNEAVQIDHPILSNAAKLLEAIRRVGLLAPEKKSLKESISNVPFYELIHSIVIKVNKKIWQHKQAFSIIGFDDQIQGVAHAMNNDAEALIESLQQEYPAALVDEFQDTDKHQYAILEHLYPKEDKQRLLLMIGDPKQAIYSFRGGDIHTYMRAKEMADKAWGMDINYRSSRSVITSYNRIFHGAALQNEARNLFDGNISYPIISPPTKDLPGKLSLIDNDPMLADAALSFICANSSRLINTNAKTKQKHDTSKDIQIDEIVNWCANEIKRLLGDVHIEQEGQQRLVSSDDIAILVRSHKQVPVVKKILSAHGLSSVFLGERSPLFESAQALHILWLLQGIHQPTRDRVRRAISTGLVLLDSNNIIQASDLLLNDNHLAWEQAYTSLAKYSLLWQQKGVHALLQVVIQQCSLQSREAERQLTNYLHIAELLAEASVTTKSPLQLIYWLHQHITNPDQADASELRLESDQKLIKIVTQHKSKGLEYPIVFLPYANHVNTKTSKHVAQYYLDNNTNITELGVSNAAKEAIAKESLAEDMRLLYVSLTRPILRCYLGVFSSVSCNSSALTRALGTSVDKDNEDDDSGATMLNNIQLNLSDIANNIFLTMADKLLPIQNDIPTKAAPNTNLLSFKQSINRRWHVTSFSKLMVKIVNVNVHARQYQTNKNFTTTDAPDLVFARDEEGQKTPLNDNGVFIANNDNLTIPIHLTSQTMANSKQNTETGLPYRFVFPKGANAGTFLHDVLETIDFTNPCIASALTALNMHTVGQHDVDEILLSQWFANILTTPLFSALAANDVCLQDLSPVSTLKEAEFYFPIKAVDLAAMSKLINTYRQQLCEQYHLSNCPFLQLSHEMIEGAMHGYIDLIFEYNGQYYIADYKSNFLGENPHDYQSKAIAQDLLLHNYDIQYLIYSVALHRYLGTYLPDYCYDLHFGGVCYLYLRGMEGREPKPSTTSLKESVNGVFFDQIEQGLLLDLHQMFGNKDQNSHLSIVNNEDKAL